MTPARTLESRSDQPVYRRGTPSEALRLADLELLARWMDSAFVVPGTNIRFGLDAIIGLVPGLGDAVTSLVSLYLMSAASRHGLSRATLARMGANVAVDFAVGAVPLVGDLFDVYWKANQKNVALLQRHLAAAPEQVRRQERSDRWFVAALVAGLLLLLVGCVTVAWWIIVAVASLIGYSFA